MSQNKINFSREAGNFLELQTNTGWGRTLLGFAEWCQPLPGWLTLDVGCGPGLLPAIFTNMGCKAVGADNSMEMFRPKPLHPRVLVADVLALPFLNGCFDLITATNLLFLLPDPVSILVGLKRLLKTGGKVAMLNPSEHLNELAAVVFADERGLEGVAKSMLVSWAKRAEENHRWTDEETRAIYARAGLTCLACTLKVGPGFAHFSMATT